MSPGRKKPHCRVCGSPMAGHKRPSGVPICSSPPSPPASPPSELTSLPASPPATPGRRSTPRPSPGYELEGVVIPEYGIWHRPNPYWQEPPRPPPSPPYAGSLVPTVVDDDMKTERESVDDGDYSNDGRTVESSTFQSDGDLLDHVLDTSEHLASVFSTPKAEVPLVCEIAERAGLHFGSLKTDARLENWWVVIGHSAKAVKHLLDLEQKQMPGVFKASQGDVEVEACAKPTALLGFFQAVLAGAVGGIVVARGLSLL